MDSPFIKLFDRNYDEITPHIYVVSLKQPDSRSDLQEHRQDTLRGLASALGMADMCPRVGIPIDKDLLRNLDDQVAESVEKARVVFQAELKAQIASLRNDLWEMVKAQDRPPPQPAVNKPLKGWQPPSGGGSY